MKFLVTLLLLIPSFCNVSYSEMYDGKNLEGNMLLCKNTDFNKEINPKPKPFILKEMFIKFYGKDGFDQQGNKQFAAEVSILGVIPDDFYTNILFDDSLVQYAIGSLHYSGESFLNYEFPSYAKPKKFDISDFNFAYELYEYATSTDYVYISASTDFFHEDNIRAEFRNDWISGKSWLQSPGILISRKTLEATINYSVFEIGQYRRVENEIKILQCQIVQEDLQNEYRNIERKYFDLVQDAHNKKRQKELNSTSNNLL